MSGLNEETKLFPAVDIRKSLCCAMQRRSVEEIERNIALLKSESFNGGTALMYAERLLTELHTLELEALELDRVENDNPVDALTVAESFLQMCGKLGYVGPHMFRAIQMRDMLVRRAAAVDKTGECPAQYSTYLVLVSSPVLYLPCTSVQPSTLPTLY